MQEDGEEPLYAAQQKLVGRRRDKKPDRLLRLCQLVAGQRSGQLRDAAAVNHERPDDIVDHGKADNDHSFETAVAGAVHEGVHVFGTVFFESEAECQIAPGLFEESRHEASVNRVQPDIALDSRTCRRGEHKAVRSGFQNEGKEQHYGTSGKKRINVRFFDKAKVDEKRDGHTKADRAGDDHENNR